MRIKIMEDIYISATGNYSDYIEDVADIIPHDAIDYNCNSNSNLLINLIAGKMISGLTGAKKMTNRLHASDS